MDKPGAAAASQSSHPSATTLVTCVYVNGRSSNEFCRYNYWTPDAVRTVQDVQPPDGVEAMYIYKDPFSHMPDVLVFCKLIDSPPLKASLSNIQAVELYTTNRSSRLIDAFMEACLYAGCGVKKVYRPANSSSWLYEVKRAEDKWMTRYLLQRLSGEHGVIPHFT